MAPPKLSVITATHDRRELLMRKLESLSRQTLPPEDFEVIVCDDASTDGTPEALAAARVPFRLVVLTQAENGGVAKARNRAAAAARGDLLLMSDDDCLLGSETLERHLAAHQQHSKAVLVGGLELPEEFRNGRAGESYARTARLGDRVLWINATGANTAVPTWAFQEVGGYDESFGGYGGEDPDLALRLRALGLAFRYVPDAVAFHVGRLLEGDYVAKAKAAGQAHWRVYRRFARPEVGLMLGIHPALLFLKRLVFNDLTAPLLTHPRFQYERAYLEGAIKERRHGG